eukprot:CAMPEP_0179291198 /NCGR_PEP_ID=MMETSP0797-20121207/42214_1 /TAXON_ID=47934 /ORGANISM="Dinophysis acuminata, Strain DAEP01" /LENGTH=72 /DNA_ID=CAMNT_0021000267 /DNA_START=185 /DNA_END=401 /DNA_ORIENTATION=-
MTTEVAAPVAAGVAAELVPCDLRINWLQAASGQILEPHARDVVRSGDLNGHHHALAQPHHLQRRPCGLARAG